MIWPAAELVVPDEDLPRALERGDLCLALTRVVEYCNIGRSPRHRNDGSFCYCGRNCVCVFLCCTCLIAEALITR